MMDNCRETSVNKRTCEDRFYRRTKFEQVQCLENLGIRMKCRIEYTQLFDTCSCLLTCSFASSLLKMLASTLRRAGASALRHAPSNSLRGRRVLCSAPKERVVSAAMPLPAGVATGTSTDLFTLLPVCKASSDNSVGYCG